MQTYRPAEQTVGQDHARRQVEATVHARSPWTSCSCRPSFKGEPLGYDGRRAVERHRVEARSDDARRGGAAGDAPAANCPGWAPSSGPTAIAQAPRPSGPTRRSRPNRRPAAVPDRAPTTNPTTTKPDDDEHKPTRQRERSNTTKSRTDKAKPDDAKTPAADAKHYAVNFPLGDFGAHGPPEQPKAVLFRNATVWTSGPQGILESADLLVESGKITAVGTRPDARRNAAVVIDAAGKHLSPGIIDCHSHVATDGGVNESGQTITAEVRIGDFVDPQRHQHLSPVGRRRHVVEHPARLGQHDRRPEPGAQVPLGRLPEEMKFAAAPPGIKFALGENVKQSNWRRTRTEPLSANPHGRRAARARRVPGGPRVPPAVGRVEPHESRPAAARRPGARGPGRSASTASG